MASRPDDDLLRRANEELRRGSIEALLSFQNQLRRYAGPPGVADESTRTAIREDLVITATADLLGSHSRPLFRVLDACCGLGGLASHLANNLSDRSARVVYHGIDQNVQYIARARRPQSTSTKFKLNAAEYRIGEVWQLPIEWHGTMDLVVLSNTLHELPPSRFPELFDHFNSIITPETGRVCVIDMEELPIGEPEAIAINWKLEEVESFLKSGGFEVTLSNHPKSVSVFRVIVKHSKNVLKLGMLNELKTQLKSKLASLAAVRMELTDFDFMDDESLISWMVLTGSLARCAEELVLIEQRMEAWSTAASGGLIPDTVASAKPNDQTR